MTWRGAVNEQEGWNVDIAMVGAGITGQAAALALRKQASTLGSLSAAGTAGGAGVTLWPNASFVLEKLGVLHAIQAVGGRPLAMRRYDAAGNALGGLNRTAGPEPWATHRNGAAPGFAGRVARTCKAGGDRSRIRLPGSCHRPGCPGPGPWPASATARIRRRRADRCGRAHVGDT